jgi:DNA mismatch repair protein MutS
MSSELTPMMQQYHRIKQSIPPDALLFFRLGDFYEMFFDDAKIASDLLNLTLTQRQGTPMCGLPFHAAEGYIAKLIQAGKRVAICDQVEKPQAGQVVKREVTQILSPGSVIDTNLLESKQNNFVAALLPSSPRFGLAFLDLSTGEFLTGEVATLAEAYEEITRRQPAELIVPTGQKPHPVLDEKLFVVEHDDWSFSPDAAHFTLKDHFKTQSLDGFGLGDFSAGLGAAGGLLHYLAQELRRDLKHVRRITTFRRGESLILDRITQRNLELVESTRTEARDVTLLKAIDRTTTAGGGRLLRHWLLQPLLQLEPLLARQDGVAFWQEKEPLREKVREQLRGVKDLERLIGRLSQGAGNARDLLALKLSLLQLPALRETVIGVPVPLVQQLAAAITPLPTVVDLLEKAIADEPPLSVKEGGLIRPGYHAELDELRSASTAGKDWLAQLQLREQERTGIKSLKVRYNQVFGYYIEITKANLQAVPDDYTRKQTMVNAERFITPELKEIEGKILGAEERSRQLEYDLFLQVREVAIKEIETIQQTAHALSALDVLAGWGALAQEQGYVRPLVDQSTVLQIEEGRHPVLDQQLLAQKFVPNDTVLDAEEQRLVILTGPNMAGKSTYIRQVALLAILAHCGCFVPAKKMRLGLLDRVFTRIGASDDLSRGQSTFMVEMNETANILNHATARSLVILDEIGRGTSTFDGLSIAWSVAEYLHTQLQAKTLFATHYHELTELAQLHPAVKNYNVAVREWKDQVIFLHKIIPGGADKSYGIHVARLAGLPASVLDRAKDILRELEEKELDETGRPKRGKNPKKTATAPATTELDLFKSL